ncbi:aminoglycoside adenylyltransferase domain-containing protein [Bacillus sp. MUM 13]|uniref:aminoglycoside adenylyltransferase domain-containing protein n=1 Tax=Bacillus sp. MUM 13 TaxID=1678001 RepID=UPI0011143C6D|nr:aminoglycoside adenylyltransferase domain-containing protein [Bacillus sp. MUM 13]
MDSINNLLDAYFDNLEKEMPDNLEAFYLYGSSSLGAYQEGRSDIDFIAVIKKKAADKDIQILKRVHKLMHKHSKIPLDGWYVIQEDLGCRDKSEIPALRFNEGKFYGENKFDKNSIDAYQLKKYGIAVKGPNIEQAVLEVDWDILLKNMRNNLNTYWVNWVCGCRKFPSARYIYSLASLSCIEWGVLGISRLYFTFREYDITSKAGAGEYALQTVPEKWHKIIHESLRLRKGIKKSSYTSIFERRREALGYMEYIIEECNRHFKSQIL